MQIIQSRRDFLASLSAAGAAGVLGAQRIARRRGAAGNHHDPAAPATPNICLAPAVRRRGPAARGRVHRCPLRARHRGPRRAADGRARRDRLRHSRPRQRSSSSWMPAQPVTALAGVHSGCYELFAHEPIRSISDLKGRSVGIKSLTLGRAPVSGDHGRPCRARPAPGHRLGRPAPAAIPWSCSPKGRSMRSLAFRPSRRSCAPARSVA